MRAQAFPRMLFSLALLFNRLVFTTLDLQEIGTLMGRVALAVAWCTFGDCKVNPLRILGGLNRSRCGAVQVLRSQSEPFARFAWVESLLLWCGSHFETAK